MSYEGQMLAQLDMPSRKEVEQALLKIKIMKKNKIIYSLTVEDIQTVANQELGRDLSSEEIEKIIEPIADNINWFDAIAEAIQKINEEAMPV